MKAVLGLSYPEAWSSKAGQESRRPHLSTLDALVAAAQLAEAILVSAMDLSSAERRWVWLQRATIRAGAKAVEDLGEVEVAGELVESRPYDNPLFSNSRLLRTRFTIGALRVELDIVSPVAQARTISQSYRDVDDLLGCKSERYYGEGFKADRITIGVQVECARLSRHRFVVHAEPDLRELHPRTGASQPADAVLPRSHG